VDTGSGTVHKVAAASRTSTRRIRRHRVFLLQPWDDTPWGRDREGGGTRLRLPGSGRDPSPAGMSRSSFSTSADRTPLAAQGYRKGAAAEDPRCAMFPPGTELQRARSESVRPDGFRGGKAGDRRIVQPERSPKCSAHRTPMFPSTSISGSARLDARRPWDIDIRNGGAVAHHAGATLLFHGQMIVLPERKLGVVVLANSDTRREFVGKWRRKR